MDLEATQYEKNRTTQYTTKFNHIESVKREIMQCL